MLKIIVAAIAAACLAIPALAAGHGDSGCQNPVPTIQTVEDGCANHESETPDQPASEDEHHNDGPNLSTGFVNRIWKVEGLGNGYEAGVLDFTASRFVHIPKRYRHQDDAIVGEDSRVLVSEKTRVYDEQHHRLTGADRDAALDDADTVTVVGKVRPDAQWQTDEDGIAVPTFRAKRITITG
jgi:hypothetical protein